jgi:hypothetical protein
MVVRDHEFDAEQAAALEADQEVTPSRPALAVGQFHVQHLAPALPIDSDRNQHRLALGWRVSWPRRFCARLNAKRG